MELNPNLPLIMRDLRVYDIEACHYTILKNKGYDLSHIDPEDKLGRNIMIGQMMRDNPRITSLLRNTTESIINDYININNIEDDDIVIRQYDGLILKRKLDVTNIGHMPLELRQAFKIFISSINRRSYIALDGNNELTVKGVPFKYKAMNGVYRELCSMLNVTKPSLFTRLQKLKDDFFETENPELFGIPVKNNKFNIFLLGYGELEVSQSTLKIMDTDDVDRERYFKFYIEPFTKSIVYENVR